MENILQGLKNAATIIISFDKEFLEIVSVSIRLSVSSTAIAAVLGVPAGVAVHSFTFPGRQAVKTILSTLMSLPTVVVGLTVYAFLSRSGPLGSLGLLYTRAGIIIGQSLLIFPIIASLTISSVESMDIRIRNTALSLGANPSQAFSIFLKECRYGISAAVIAAFGRVFAEVGVSMMLGGNIRHYTRTITTAIALETSKGAFAMGIALGAVLLMVAFIINTLFIHIQRYADR